MNHNLPLPNLHLPNFPDLADLSRASGSLLATLGMGIAIGLPLCASADPLDESPDRATHRMQRFDADGRPPKWMGENVAYKKGLGLEYSHETKLGARPVELGIGGPILKAKKESSAFSRPGPNRRISGAGLTFELRY